MLSKFQQDLKTAMKAGEKGRVLALRNIIAKVKARQIDKGEDLKNDEIQKILQSYAKQLKDSINQYTNAGRMDLADNESAELILVENYLPKQLSDDEIKAIVQNAINETGASGIAEMGKVMPVVMKAIAGRGDGKVAQQFVKELLS